MHYVIRKKLWGFGKDFYIEDDSGARVFSVQSPLFSWARKLSIQDPEGNELALVTQKFWSLRRHYSVYRDGVLFAEITKRFNWMKSRFVLSVPGRNDYTIEGSLMDHSFVFLRGGRTVATASLAFFLPYVCNVDIVDGEDVVAILTTCLIIIVVIREQQSAVA